ncbi:lycopene cyclase family protein [Gordonia bronchialis]|uniref:lycopene cyclase family protein n=1 Tax=Gordonia bronchialis TaxID=2054 RepID=UPI00242B679B|nr:lycopene cyclase family protein [Gordonia bronchialis]
MPDVIVVGAGPAGRALTHRLLARDVTVTLVDPAPDRPWRSTYACWADEIPDWLDTDRTIAASVSTVAVWGRRHHTVTRPYSVFDTAALQRCLSVDDAFVVAARAGSITPTTIRLDDGTSMTAAAVIDARGSVGAGPRQTAWGVVVPRSAARPALGEHEAVLMDWRDHHQVSGDELGAAPSFLYAVPLDADRVLLEETCLAGDPAIEVAALRERLGRRLAAIGVDAAAVTGTEAVSFRLTGVLGAPWRHAPPLFGARAGIMHPATGYSVAAALAAADPLARELAAGGDPNRQLWPTRARIVHRLRQVGLRALLDFDAPATVDFFDTFFDLPTHRQRTYLSDRTDAAALSATMAALFAACDNRTRRRLARAVLTPR